MTSTICKQEILTDILARLPSKSLIRFLCACKSWSDLISNPSFVSTHLTKGKNIHLLCLHHPEFRKEEDLDDSYVKKPLQWSLFNYQTFEQELGLSNPTGSTEHFAIYGSTNGLLCVSHEELSSRSPIHIWNPSINKLKTVPMSTGNNYKFRYFSLQFGFHPGVNDYKVVRMIWFAKDTFAIEVYSLSTDSWKMVQEIPPWLQCKFRTVHDEGTFINGVAYQLIEKGHLFSVISFDSESEEFEEFIAPDPIIGSSRLHLDAYDHGEKPCLLFHWDYWSQEDDLDRCDIWVLEEKRWKSMRPFLYPKNMSYPIGVSINNELMTWSRDYSDGSADMFLANYETREARETGIKLAVMRHGCDDFLYALTYIESLVSLN